MLGRETIQTDRWLIDLRDGWQELWSDSQTATPFQSWEWVSSWWGIYSGIRRSNIFVLKEGDDLIGLIPLFVTQFPWRALRVMGTGASDYLHPLVRTGYEMRFAAEFQDYLSQLEGVDLIDLHQQRESEALTEFVCPTGSIPQARCCVLDLPGTFDEYLGTLSKSLRYEARRIMRAPFVGGNARIETAKTTEDAQRALEIFFELHASRWKRRGMPGAFALSRTRKLHEEFARLAIGRDMLRLAVMWHEDRPVGSLYVMKTPRAHFFFQSGFHPSARSLSPGSTLVAHSIKTAIDEGAVRFDFLRGDEPYKRRWKPQNTYTNLRFMKRVGKLRGAAGHVWNQAGDRVESMIRERFEGRGLLS